MWIFQTNQAVPVPPALPSHVIHQLQTYITCQFLFSFLIPFLETRMHFQCKTHGSQWNYISLKKVNQAKRSHHGRKVGYLWTLFVHFLTQYHISCRRQYKCWKLEGSYYKSCMWHSIEPIAVNCWNCAQASLLSGSMLVYNLLLKDLLHPTWFSACRGSLAIIIFKNSPGSLARPISMTYGNIIKYENLKRFRVTPIGRDHS